MTAYIGKHVEDDGWKKDGMVSSPKMNIHSWLQEKRLLNGESEWQKRVEQEWGYLFGSTVRVSAFRT